MPGLVAVGVQWGDEGKGKVVDFLTENATTVVRFQGGNNAGHTLVIEGKKTALRIIPSGILRPSTRCLLAAGVVVNPEYILGELAELRDAGVDVSADRIGIAPEIHLILPYHLAIDIAREEKRAGKKIGTTGRGIGPAYEDFVCRSGVRIAHLANHELLKEVIERNVETKNKILSEVLGSDKKFCEKEIYEYLASFSDKILPYVLDVGAEICEAYKRKELVLFEGAQGSLLDVSHGTYPFVTSSNTLAGYASVSAGISPGMLDRILGVCKAYCTRVGSGPFPTEDDGETGEMLRTKGGEFGTTTGRPRRCGWFDAQAVRYAARLNGLDSLFITKLDVLSGLSKIKVGLSYEDNLSPSRLAISGETPGVEYTEMPGWDEDITAVRSFDDLPKNAQGYLNKLSELVEVPISGFSVGPDREQTVIVDRSLLEA